MLRNQYWKNSEQSNKNSYTCVTLETEYQIRELIVSKRENNEFNVFLQFNDYATLPNQLLKDIADKFYNKIGGRPPGRGLFEVNPLFNTVVLERKDSKLTKAMIKAVDEVMPFGKDIKEGILNFVDPARLLSSKSLLSQPRMQATDNQTKGVSTTMRPTF